MTNKEKAKKLHEIADALGKWGKYNEKVTNAAEWNTPEAKQIIRNAITLLVDNLGLLNECKNKYGLHGFLKQCFTNIEQAASWPKTKDFGDYQGWRQDFTERPLWEGEKRSFADECVRYANEVDKETEQENKGTKKNQKGVLDPKPPEFLQKLLWMLKYGRKYWGLILLAIFLLLLWGIFVWPKFDFFSRFYPPTKKDALNNYNKTTSQESKVEKKEVEANIEKKSPQTIKKVEPAQFFVKEGQAQSIPELGLIVSVKRFNYDDETADLRLTLPGHNKIIEKKAASGEKWDFQFAETQYRLVLIAMGFHEEYLDNVVVFELSQIEHK